MKTIDELTQWVANKITKTESRTRNRTSEEQIRFIYAVNYLIVDILKAYHTHPDKECSIQKNKNFYSQYKRYRDPNLTYRMAMAAFDGLQKLGMIVQTKSGYYDHINMEGDLTRYKPTHSLLERFEELDFHPAIHIKPNLDAETIILRNKIDGKRYIVDYEETSFTDQARQNLKKINSCLARHWADLKIKDTEFTNLQEKLLLSEEKQPIDFSNKLLVRIFINNSFKEGGRFYRGWWQNVPSEYRKFITINSKRTNEYDYSQLNPNMIYSLYNLELGSEDAYSRVLNGEHRNTVKEAFNAMLQSDTQLHSKPKGIDLSKIEISWKELRQAVLNAHKPIKHMFFTGLGNKLQFEDSNIAEGVMLHFSKMDAVALPVHDSFIMHHAYGSMGELEEAMRRAFYERFNRDIGVKHEMVEEVQHENDKSSKDVNLMDLEELLDDDKEFSKWEERNTFWRNINKYNQ